MTEQLRRVLVLMARVSLAATALFVLYEATGTNPPDPGVEEGDKLLHALAFFSLAILADFAFPESGFGIAKVSMLLGFGILIECIQHFLPWRSSDMLDLVADGAGIALYVPLVPLLRHIPLIRERWSR